LSRKLRILALEPYYGGSHRAFLDALVRHSRHDFTLMTLPARKWKWRMRGSAIWFAREPAGHPPPNVDLILATDMVSVADLKSVAVGGLGGVPVVCYFHENQLTYPLPDESQRDYQYGFTNITSCLAADAVWFNSRFHREDFLAAAALLLQKMPDYVPDGIVADVRQRSSVMYPLVETDSAEAAGRVSRRTEGPLRILWNHRWEYDKNPEAFFETMIRLNDAGHDFRLVIVGETFREAPGIFAEAWARLRGKIEQAGFVKSRADYLAVLASCDLVVSTSIQENFGIAVVEAMAAGCRPLLPDRLSYPELIPESVHHACLYRDDDELRERLCDLTEHGYNLEVSGLRDFVVERFSAERNIDRYDAAFERLVEGSEGA